MYQGDTECTREKKNKGKEIDKERKKHDIAQSASHLSWLTLPPFDVFSHYTSAGVDDVGGAACTAQYSTAQHSTAQPRRCNSARKGVKKAP